jgi:predicted phosphodiesterase
MIAIISDTHGNYPALEAVLRDIDGADCPTVYSLGDVAGYYCMVNECMEAFRDRRIVNLMGNHDQYLVSQTVCSRSNAVNRCITFQRQVVSAPNLAWLGESLRSLDIDDLSMVHGGWNDPVDEYLYEVNEPYFAALPGKFFFSGHTHVQVLATFSDKIYCNPGSVGQPRDGDPRAAYALYDRGNVTLKRVAYDIDRIAFEMGKAGFEPYYFENLYAGRRIGGKVTRVKITR